MPSLQQIQQLPLHSQVEMPSAASQRRPRSDVHAGLRSRLLRLALVVAAAIGASEASSAGGRLLGATHHQQQHHQQQTAGLGAGSSLAVAGARRGGYRRLAQGTLPFGLLIDDDPSGALSSRLLERKTRTAVPCGRLCSASPPLRTPADRSRGSFASQSAAWVTHPDETKGAI